MKQDGKNRNAGFEKNQECLQGKMYQFIALYEQWSEDRKSMVHRWRRWQKSFKRLRTSREFF